MAETSGRMMSSGRIIYLYEYLGTPEADTKLFLPLPSSHDVTPCISMALGDSTPAVESDNMVEVSSPFARIGMVEFLLELLFPMVERLLCNLMQSKAAPARSTPIKTPVDKPIVNPKERAPISLVLLHLQNLEMDPCSKLQKRKQILKIIIH